MEYDLFYTLFISINLSTTFVIMLAACLCCRKKVPKNEFLGMEGMVKLKNPEDGPANLESAVQIDMDSSNGGDTDSKRASNAPHRSLPDIPIIEALNDNGSELYATVTEKVQQKPQGRSPTPSLKKQISVSQHSSISQADDISSPYARVKTPSHAYDKVRTAEHPYAQLNTPGPSSSQHIPNFTSPVSVNSRRSSSQSLLEVPENPQEIPAASAIAGMVSASQELPYMTPPIVQQQSHFSGDSQDSSKGYTSISVREPLANIIAQTKHPVKRLMPKNGNDSHYATVSDDSDEMYAAIDDHNNHGEVYTSGSETYAQIQPTQALTVAAEINTLPGRVQAPEGIRLSTAFKKVPIDTPFSHNVDNLKAQMHSRQASSSSNTSSIANLGSPKPEKRQANSPLPPTPKNVQYLSNSNLTSTSSIPSGRNSVASVIECHVPIAQSARFVSKENLTGESNAETPTTKNFSPSKDIEGMYAKVMKKSKFSSAPSHNASPILSRKMATETSTSNIITSDLNLKDLILNAIHASPGKSSIKSASYIDNNYETIEKRRTRSNSYSNKNHSYETIPVDKGNENNNIFTNRKSDGYAQIIQKELLNGQTGNALDTQNSLELFRDFEKLKIVSEPGYESLPDQSNNTIDPGYELLQPKESVDINKPVSDYDPNYEVLKPTEYQSGDDGYAKVLEKLSKQTDDMLDGYSHLKENDVDNKHNTNTQTDTQTIVAENHDYASILEADKCTLNIPKNGNNNNEDTSSDLYSCIHNEQNVSYPNIQEKDKYHNYQTICETYADRQKATPNTSMAGSTISADKLTTPSSGQITPDIQMNCSSTSNTISSGQQPSSNYESLTGSESDPNYESVRYLDSENPYERLHNESNFSPDEITKTLVNSGPKCVSSPIGAVENGDVDDYFQV